MRNKIIIAAFFVFFMVFTLLLPGATFAAEDGPLDEIINGFDDEKPEVSEDAMRDVLEGFDDETVRTDTGKLEDTKTSSVFSLDGYFKVGASYNFAHHKPGAGETDWRGLSRLRPEVNLERTPDFPVPGRRV